MKGIKFYAPVFDVSGYANWSRSIILTAIKNDIPVCIASDPIRKTGRPITFEASAPDISKGDSSLLLAHIDKDIDYDYCVCILTPNMAYEQIRLEPKNKKIVNLTLWETSRLSQYWIPYLAHMDEIWVPGEWNKEVFESSLQYYSKNKPELENLKNIPVKILPYPFKVEANKLENPIELIKEDSSFKFYAISQWTERKNFTNLIEAFVHEFSKDEPVTLVIKSYLMNHSNDDKEKLRSCINYILSNIKSYEKAPRIIALHKLLSSDEIKSLHQQCDCYVSSTRGEGIGLGLVEAASFGNPVITHTFGEQGSFFNEENAYIYNYSLRPVTFMNLNQFYTSDQKWANLDICGLAKCMREAYENRDLSKEKVEKCKKDLENKFSTEVFINKLKELISY